MISVSEKMIVEVAEEVAGGRSIEKEPLTDEEAITAAASLFRRALSVAGEHSPRVPDLEPLRNLRRGVGPETIAQHLSNFEGNHADAIHRRRAKIDATIATVSGAVTAAAAVYAGGGGGQAIALALKPLVEVFQGLGNG